MIKILDGKLTHDELPIGFTFLGMEKYPNSDWRYGKPLLLYSNLPCYASPAAPPTPPKEGTKK